MERLAMYAARVVAGVVEIDQDGDFKPADDVLLLSAGAGDSSGFVVIGEAIALYFVNTQPNLAEVIAKIIEALDQTIQIANQLVVKVPNTPAVILDAAAAAELEVIKTELAAIELL